jgi:hypothetical protein
MRHFAEAPVAFGDPENHWCPALSNRVAGYTRRQSCGCEETRAIPGWLSAEASSPKTAGDGNG